MYYSEVSYDGAGTLIALSELADPLTERSLLTLTANNYSQP
jgi:hypothetical protein